MIQIRQELSKFLLKRIIKKLKQNGVVDGYNFYDHIYVYYNAIKDSVLCRIENLTALGFDFQEYTWIRTPEAVLYDNGIPHDLKCSKGTYYEKYYDGLLSYLTHIFPEYNKDKVLVNGSSNSKSNLEWTDFDTEGLQALINKSKLDVKMWEA